MFVCTVVFFRIIWYTIYIRECCVNKFTLATERKKKETATNNILSAVVYS